MPVNLTCYVDRSGYRPRSEKHRTALPYATARFDQNWGFYERIEKLQPKLLGYPILVELHDDKRGHVSVRMSRDGYDKPLTYVTAAQLRKLRRSSFGMAEWNRALLAMLTSLPDEAIVVLYWD